MKRRHFLHWAALTAANSIKVGTLAGLTLQRTRPRELKADLVIVGGGTGGCAAALAALRNGLQVIMTEETDWIGGQLTQQAVPPDEHPWIESFGGTKAYRKFRSQVREYYRLHYPLTAEA
jgi:NADPH-dependent 2,4-dienoyl-CoA reductase/sulfur reductase-like enzyme